MRTSRSCSIYASKWSCIKVYIRIMKILTLKTELQNEVQNGLDYTSKTTSVLPYAATYTKGTLESEY